MAYEWVAVYAKSGEFLGYAVKETSAKKLQSTNLWFDGEEDKLEENLNRLNNQIDINAHWPDPRDPDVLLLLSDPEFMPIEYEDQEVVDDEHSTYVWLMEAETDLYGNPTGEMVEGPLLDHDRSDLHYKVVSVAKNPSDVVYRTRAACEQVARSRANC